jgi:hypothetical protein
MRILCADMAKQPLQTHVPLASYDLSSQPMEPFPNAAQMPQTLSVHAERVRFAATGTLELEGVDQPLPATVINLSTQGACCVLQREIPRGKRVWLRCRLDMGAEPVTLVSEVVWTHSTREGVQHGLHFVALPEPVQALLENTVRERTEGIAAEWTLPNIPPLADIPELEPLKNSSKRTATTLAASVCLGLGMALLVVAVAPETVAWLNPVRQMVLKWLSAE